MTLKRKTTTLYTGEHNGERVLLFRDVGSLYWGFTVGDYTVDGFAYKRDARAAMELVVAAK